jgi:hypothetical protein
MRRVGWKSAIALVLVGCATSGAPSFQPRPAPATTTASDDDALMAAGYVTLGSLAVSVERERCRGTDVAARCEPVDRTGQGVTLLLEKAASRGGDLVRIAHQETPTTVAWVEMDCQAGISSFVGRGAIVLDSAQPYCAEKEKVVGTRRLTVTDGTVWRRAPSLVPQMMLARAIERGDEARVATLLPQIDSLDVHLGEPPLVIAATRGNVAILRRLLAARAKAGREAALLVAVARGDEAIARELLAAGVSPDTADPLSRDRPLHTASRRKASPGILKLLIDAGADVNALNEADQMPLQAALLSCDVGAAEILIQARADRAWARADETTMELIRSLCPDQAARLVELLAAH